MELLAVIIALVIIGFLVQCIIWNSERKTYGFGMFCGLALVAAFAIEIICICSIISEPSPTAMDVYQGKTSLEYTIRDGVKVDSVVAGSSGASINA